MGTTLNADGPDAGWPEVEDRVRDFLGEHPIDRLSDRELRAARFRAGLAFPHFRHGSGGLGWHPSTFAMVEAAFLAAGATDWSDRNIIGLGMAAPTLHEHGTEAQRALLEPLFVGQDIWCQLFSEPGAGSDLAGIATQAVRDGDDYVVTGQKVWTTLAHLARYGLLVARTDASAPRHAGLSYFVLDMTSLGIEVRPLRQMTGEAEFNEVFLDEVRVPRSALLGNEGDGWKVALTTLMNERVSFRNVSTAAGSGTIARAVEAHRQARGDGRTSGADRDRLMRLWVASEAARLTGLRAGHAARRGVPGPEASVGKLAMAELNKATFSFAVDQCGATGMLIDDYAELRPDGAAVHGGADLRKAFLRTRANSIEGGTSEVLRNVLAERVLGLPREPRPQEGSGR